MIKLENVTVEINAKTILNNISLVVNQGEVVSIIGPSGAGKSTLLRCINLLVKPNTGRIGIGVHEYDLSTIKNHEIKKIREFSSMVFQQHGLFENKTVLENVSLPIQYVKGRAKQLADKYAREVLDQVGLQDKADEYPGRLSGGQQQRVGIARALAMQPSILLLDEPTSALDLELISEVQKIIKSLSKKRTYTMVIVTHELAFARKISDRIIFMDQGKIIETGSPTELFESPKQSRVAAFLEKITEIDN